MGFCQGLFKFCVPSALVFHPPPQPPTRAGHFMGLEVMQCGYGRASRNKSRGRRLCQSVFLHACSDSSSLHSQSLRGERCLDKLVLSHVNEVSPNESDACAYVLQRKNASVKSHKFVSAYKYLWHARYVLVDLDQTTHRVLRTCPSF